LSPALDTSRCVRNRHFKASCRACAAACPRDAITIDRHVHIGEESCSECGICSAACPTGALAGAADALDAAIGRLAAIPAQSVGCRQVLAGFGDTRLRCFGGLSARDLAAMAILTERPLVINVAPCGKCPAGPDVIPLLRKRLESVAAAGVLGSRPLPVLRADFGPGPESPTGASRRGFLSLFARAASQARQSDGAPQRTRRERHQVAADRVDQDMRPWLLADTLFTPHKLASCNDCCRCALVCPSGALQRTRRNGRKLLTVTADACTGCGLCIDMCPLDALDVPSAHSTTTA